MDSIALAKNLIDHFKITEYYQANPGGQKTVFIITIEGVKYALKIINIADERFEREVKICEEFHKNGGIPDIIKIESFGKSTIILEQYIEGNDLSDIESLYLNEEDKILKLLYSVSVIMTPVWEAKYVHRDLKPQNIRIKTDNKPVVLDFGIARALNDETITVTGNQPLSYFYASPEQYSGDKKLISYRTDFFCLAIIAYKLYTGKFPFGDTKEEIEARFNTKKLKVNSGSEKIDNLCNSVFKYYPSERTRTISTFLKLLR